VDVTRASRTYWACQAGGWALYVVTTIYQLARHLDLTRAVVEPILATLIGIALTHTARERVLRARWASLGVRSLASRVALTSMALSSVHVGALTVIEVGFYGDSQVGAVRISVFAFFRWTLIFLVWLVLYVGHALIEQRRAAELNRLELERALKDAELGALRSQLNPHFLFNSLNGIRALVSDDPARAQAAITQVSRILRYTLGSRDEETVTLERELAIVDDYLALEALRLDTRLTVEQTIEAEAQAFQIPNMLLQTLVENAIKHGISELPAGGVLRLSARVVDGALSIVVENPRPTSTVRRLDDGGSGVGLVNATERLRLLFGSQARLNLDLSTPGNAVARMTIPPVSEP
jgi:LytS/YehU family sensor histidine kinase